LSSSTSDITLSTLTVTGLTPGTPYFFRVGSLNWNQAPDFSAALPGSTASGGAPRALSAVWGFMNSVSHLFVLTWHAVTLDVNGLATTIDHYLIERSDSRGSAPTFTDSVTAPSLSYSQDTGGNTYFYRVTAVGTNGFASSPSDYVDSSAQANRY